MLAMKNPFSAYPFNSNYLQSDLKSAADIHRIAQAGVIGDAKILPYLDRLQACFGSAHNLNNISVYMDKAAQQACRWLGVNAYALGNRIAFSHENPSLFLVAHEVTHVIQQRSGQIILPEGIGEYGDSYEQEADIIANAVSQGLSVAHLLSVYSIKQITSKQSLLQFNFIGFAGGGGWALSGVMAVPANVNNYVGGANHNPGGRQAGAQGQRVVDVDHNQAYQGPVDLGGMAYFEHADHLGNLAFKTDQNQRATRMHVINGKWGATNVADNMVLANTTNNNHHAAQFETPLTRGLPGAARAANYLNELNNTPPVFEHPVGADKIVLWDQLAVNIPGVIAVPAKAANHTPNLAAAIAAANKAGKIGGGGATFYVDLNDAVHTNIKSQAGNPGRWLNYQIQPIYANAMPPTLEPRYPAVLAQAAAIAVDEAVKGIALAGKVIPLTAAIKLINPAAPAAGVAAGAEYAAKQNGSTNNQIIEATAQVALYDVVAFAKAVVAAHTDAAGGNAAAIAAAVAKVNAGNAVAEIAAGDDEDITAAVAGFALAKVAGSTAAQVAETARDGARHVAGVAAGDTAARITLAKDYQEYISKSFPRTLRMDATLYRPSYDDADPWYSRAEVQQNFNINQW